MTPDQYASVRYLASDVQATIDFYTTHPGFTPNTRPAPAFAGVVHGPPRLLISGPASSGRTGHPRQCRPQPHPPRRCGRDAEITRLRDAGQAFRGDVIAGPGLRQILLADPADNLIELFQPAHRPAAPAEAS